MTPAARVLIPAEEVGAAVRRLGGELSAAYPDGVLLVAVLKGSVLFLADLVRAMSVSPEVDFLSISAYGERIGNGSADAGRPGGPGGPSGAPPPSQGSGRVRILKDLDVDINGRDVVLVEDIVDTGLTLTYLLGVLRRREPRSLEVCALLDKGVRRIVPTPVRFVGFEIGDEFVIGYGLDYAERYRNLGEILAGDLGALRSDPDAHVKGLYSG